MNETPNPWLLAQASLKYFTAKFLNYKWPIHYQEWSDILDKNDRILFQAPRGHGKSVFFSLAYPLWRVIRGKTEVLLVSYSEDQVRRLIREIRIAVESNVFLSPLRPSTAEVWGTDQLSFANGSFISGLGFGTSSRGRHPDVIVVDDPLKDLGGMTDEDQERAYFGVITGMAMEKTKLVTVGTPVNFGDLLEKLEKNPAYTTWKKPALNEQGEPMFPYLWSANALKLKRQEMGSINFAREYLLERIDPTTQPFKREYTTLTDDIPERGRFMVVNTVCDPAYTEGDGDFTAIVTVGITHGNHGYVLRRDRLQRDQPGDVVNKLFEHVLAYDPDNVGIKRRKGDAISFSFEERRTRENLWDFNYVQLKDTKSKTDKSRIGGLVPRWEARTIHIPKGMDDLLKEFYEFRLDDSHKHDDMLDALADCFSPDMAQPNAGKRNKMLPESRRESKAFLSLGPQTDRQPNLHPGNFLGRRLDRRIYDAA